MARTTFVNTVIALLLVGASTLNVVQEPARKMCGEKGEKVPYMALHARAPGMCTVYCVPEGQCEQLVQTGNFNYLGISAQGNCKEKGFTEQAVFDLDSDETQQYFRTFTGTCKG